MECRLRSWPSRLRLLRVLSLPTEDDGERVEDDDDGNDKVEVGVGVGAIPNCSRLALAAGTVENCAREVEVLVGDNAVVASAVNVCVHRADLVLRLSSSSSSSTLRDAWDVCDVDASEEKEVWGVSRALAALDSMGE